MNSTIDWNIHIYDSFDKDPKTETIDAVPGKHKIVFITCRTWEDAEKIKTHIEQEIVGLLWRNNRK